MELKKGQRIRVTDNASFYNGKTGKVVKVDEKSTLKYEVQLLGSLPHRVWFRSGDIEEKSLVV